jgi:hypothetical protein
MTPDKPALQEWQHGYTLDSLRAFAAVFKAQHKSLCYGAFSLARERDIAASLAVSGAVWTGKPPQALALVRKLVRDSTPADFSGRPIRLRAPGFLVTALAGYSAELAGKVLASVISRAGGAPVYVETFEEDAISRAAVNACGLHYLGTKVLASSEIKGLYGPLPEREALPAEELATLSIIDRDFLSVDDLATVRSELAAATAKFAQHYSTYNKRQSWTALSLRGFSADPQDITKPAEMAQSWQLEHPAAMSAPLQWSAAAPQFAGTIAALERHGWTFERVRFMALRHGNGELTRHADITNRDAGVEPGKLLRLHVPIYSPESCLFRAWDARGRELSRHLPHRALCYLDQRKPHAVLNPDPRHDRIHLVLDTASCTDLRKRLRAVEQAEQAERAAPAPAEAPPAEPARTGRARRGGGAAELAQGAA